MALNKGNHDGSTQSTERDPGLDRLYQAAGREGPPPRLDAAILAAARREVGARPRSLASTLRTWRVPASIAAVVVLSVSLVTLVREEGGDELVQRGSPGAPRPATPVPEPARDAPKAAAPAGPSSARDLRGDSPAGRLAAREAMEDSTRRESARQGRESGAGPAAEQAAKRGPQPFQTAPDAAAGAAAAPTAGADDRGGAPAASAERRAPSATAGSAAEAAGGLAKESQRPVPMADAKPAPAPSPPPRMERDIASGDAGSSVRGMGSPAVSAAPAERPRVQGELRAQKREGPQDGASRIQALLKEFDTQPPEKWLERIQELKREGRPADAEEMLAEFKRRFPAHPLPSGL